MARIEEASILLDIITEVIIDENGSNDSIGILGGRSGKRLDTTIFLDELTEMLRDRLLDVVLSIKDTNLLEDLEGKGGRLELT